MSRARRSPPPRLALPDLTLPRLALLAVALLAIGATPLAAQVQVPAHDGWVTDLGDFLDAGEEAELERLMESYEEGSGHEIALLTLPDLGGRTIEEVALVVAREWGIGKQEAREGALLLVSRAERRTRIEVSTHLEDRLTDAICRRILDDILRPRFRAGDMAGGLRAAVEAMHAAAGGDYAALDRAARDQRVSTGANAVFSLLFLAFILIMSFASRNARRGGMGGLWPLLFLMGGSHRHGRHHGGFGGGGGGGFGGGGFGGFGGGGSFGGGGASGGW